MTKLKRQMAQASPSAKQLSAEMLWALLLFPSNMKARTKHKQITDLWNLSGEPIPAAHPLLKDDVLVGIGSGGPGFNNYRPSELEFLLELARDLKRRSSAERALLNDYDSFFAWINGVPREGSRQFRHMLRYFAFPEKVERISSNNDRVSILAAFGVAQPREMSGWSDRQLDDALLNLRNNLATEHPGKILDFYEAPLRDRWASERKLKTSEGEVTVTVPTDEDEIEHFVATPVQAQPQAPEVRQSFQIQSSLSKIGIKLGFKIWIPRSDRGRVAELLDERDRGALIESLPLNNDTVTLNTIEQIDVLWLRGRWIARAFEVEHTTAVYSGLLRMADLLALQPNMDIRLHIVAPDERREKVFREMQRPVFSLLERGPLSKSCTFISYESVGLIASMEHLAHMNDSIVEEYQEVAGS
ncbi:MAG TPA: hypothetical protein VGU25_16455 [Acidobacteriaceae bacterium]|nr:hypothetical protein [Acidobacteriaceae bacterium]